jgi:hypothetical protein
MVDIIIFLPILIVGFGVGIPLIILCLRDKYDDYKHSHDRDILKYIKDSRKVKENINKFNKQH